MTEACEALKISLDQKADGYVVVFRIKEEDIPDSLLRARINARLALAIAEIDTNEELVPPAAIEAGKQKRKQNSNVMRAAIVGADPFFQQFLSRKYRKEWEAAIGQGADQAAEALRSILGIASRKELATSDEALRRFDKVMAKYEMWKRGE